MKKPRLLAGLLAVTMSLSSVFPSLAFNDSAQGNNGAGIVTGSGGDFSANVTGTPTSGKLGVRLSLVRASNPSEVISVNKDGKPMVVDILYVTESVWNHQAYEGYHSNLDSKYMFTNVKTQNLMDAENDWNKQEVKQVFYDEINNYFSGEENMPPWLIHTNDKYTSRGEEFVDWCTKDSFGNYAIGADGNLITTQTTTSIYGYPYTIDVAEKQDGDYAEVKNSLTGSYVTGSKEQVYNKRFDELKSKLDDLCNTTNNVTGHKLWEAIGATYFEAMTLYQASQLQEDSAYKKSFEWFESNFNRPVLKLGEQLKKIGTTYINNYFPYGIQTTGEGFLDLSNFYGPGIMRLAEQAASLSEGKEATNQAPGQTNNTNNATGADTSDPLRLKSHIRQILDMQVDGELLFQTPSMLEARKNPDANKEASTLVGTKKDGNTVTEDYEVRDRTTLNGCDEDWVLLVEPIVWLTIFAEGTDKIGIHSKIYGTITNIVQAYNQPTLSGQKNSLYDYRNRWTFNYKALNAPVWWALTVPDAAHTSGLKNPTGGYVFDRSKNSTPTYGFRPADGIGQYRTFEQLYKSLTQPEPRTLTYVDDDGEERSAQVSTIEGWGVNAYWGKEMEPRQISSTITYNKDKTTTEKYPVKVAKWYVYRTFDESGNVKSETTVDVKTGTINTPVKIENEPTSDGSSIWLVTKWGTGTDPNAVPGEGDTRSTFEDYYKKSPGSYGGTKPAVLDLTNDPQEKVLYEKLVITNITPPISTGQVTIIKVKEPSTGGNAYIEKSTADPGNYDASETDWDYKEDTQTPNDPQDVHKWSEVARTSEARACFPFLEKRG